MNIILISSLLLLFSYGREPEILAMTPTVASLAEVANAQNDTSIRPTCIELSAMLMVLCPKQLREAREFGLAGGMFSTVHLVAEEVHIKLSHWPPRYITLKFKFPLNK